MSWYSWYIRVLQELHLLFFCPVGLPGALHLFFARWAKKQNSSPASHNPARCGIPTTCSADTSGRRTQRRPTTTITISIAIIIGYWFLNNQYVLLFISLINHYCILMYFTARTIMMMMKMKMKMMMMMKMMKMMMMKMKMMVHVKCGICPTRKDPANGSAQPQQLSQLHFSPQPQGSWICIQVEACEMSFQLQHKRLCMAKHICSNMHLKPSRSVICSLAARCSKDFFRCFIL